MKNSEKSQIEGMLENQSGKLLGKESQRKDERGGDGQQVRWKRACRGMCGVCKNREKKMLAVMVWLNIMCTCNVLIEGEENDHCLQIHLLARGNARAVY